MLRLFFILLFPISVFAQIPASFFDSVDIFLKYHVENGRVNYAHIAQDPKSLNELCQQIARINYQHASEPEKKAYLVNVYNILVIKQVVDNYPVNTPQEVAGFFDGNKFEVGNEKLTLNALEKSVIFRNFKDHRLHFALICAAKGCPPIANFAFRPERIEEQLNNQTRKSISNQQFLWTEGSKAYISKIFEWYADDFKQGNKTILEYINTYRIPPLPAQSTTRFYDYDWTLNDILIPDNSSNETDKKTNMQTFTPSVLLPQGRWEVKVFNNLYSQTQSFDAQSHRQNDGRRSTYLTVINQFLYGYGRNLNLGFDVWAKSVYIDASQGSALKLFGTHYKRDGRTTITGVGPKIKIAPFRKIPQLSLQTTLLVPTARNMEGRNANRPYLSADGLVWINQFFYDKPLNAKWQFFGQFATWATLGKSNYVATPITAFLSYFPNPRTTIYVQNEYWATWGSQGISSSFVQQGLGVKYQIIAGLLEAEGSHTAFTIGKNGGAGRTYNLGLRFIR